MAISIGSDVPSTGLVGWDVFGHGGDEDADGEMFGRQDAKGIGRRGRMR